MIRGRDAVRVARALLGTPYSELDCINLIKAVIRRAPGGVKKYTTATTVSLWASFDAAPKYRDLVARGTGLDGRAGALAFKGQPLGRDHQPSHVGIATGMGTVIHASSVRGEVVETPLTSAEGWTLSAVHRYITPEDMEESMIPEDEILYRAWVVTKNGSLNMRSRPSTTAPVLADIPRGDSVGVLEDNRQGWTRVRYGRHEGYVKSEFLMEEEGSAEAAGTQYAQTEDDKTVLINEEDGSIVILLGRYRIAVD